MIAFFCWSNMTFELCQHVGDDLYTYLKLYDNKTALSSALVDDQAI